MKRITTITILTICIILLAASNIALAQPPPAPTTGGTTPPPAPTTRGSAATLDDPLKLTGGPQQLIGRIINAALGIVGSLALLMFVWGGLLWMTSAGNDEKVKQGREILIWATAGLALVFFSYVLVRFVIGGLIGGELPGGGQEGKTQQELEDETI